MAVGRSEGESGWGRTGAVGNRSAVRLEPYRRGSIEKCFASSVSPCSAALTKLRCVTQRDGVASLCEMLVCLVCSLPLVREFISADCGSEPKRRCALTNVYHAYCRRYRADLRGQGRSAALMEQRCPGGNGGC